MIPVEEGDKECCQCEHYDIMFGCMPTYKDHGFPPCGRNVIVSQEVLKELIKERGEWFDVF